MLTSYRGGNLTEAAKLFSRRLDVFSPSDVLETTQVELESQSVETFGASGALNAASSDCASLLNRTMGTSAGRATGGSERCVSQHVFF
jgi:hypothetical protein